MTASPLRAPSARSDRESEYREFWPAVRGLLNTRYRGLDEQEELYQEAWTELLEYEASGHEIRDTRALLKTIAERRARDRIRNYRPVVVDPDSTTFLRTVDAAPPLEEQVQVRLDARAIRQVIESLTERESAALKLRYDSLLDATEISARLDIAPKRLQKIMTSAYSRIAEALAVGSDGESAWTKHQRSLLLACETGLATAGQRRKAEEMLAADPGCRATLAELRVALRDVAAVLPIPAAATDPDRSRRVFEAFVDSIDRVLPGGRRAGHQLAEKVAPSGAAEAASTGAAAAAVGGVTKVVLVCLAAGGTAAVCLRTDLREEKVPPAAATARRPVEVLRPVVREARAATLMVQPRPAPLRSR